MSIRNKIIYGYAVALGIALGGTIAGLMVGNYYQQQALAASQTAARERKLLSTLQVDILYNRPAKQLSPHLRNPQAFQRESRELINRVENIRLLLNNHNNSGKPVTLEGLQPLLEQYEISVGIFEKKAQDFAQKVQPLTTTKEGATKAEKQVVALVKSPEFVAFIEFPDKLRTFYELSTERETAAEAGLFKAEQLRNKIIIIGLGLSIIIAIILAIYTSRAIAQPIQSITNIAQQVTRESNFDLQLPTNNEDETGILATSLNQLMERVKQLLEEQKEYTQQLEEAKELADIANQAKSEFLANMSHELRTPLNGILGYAQILSRKQMSEEQQRGIGIIYQCGSHLLTLINDVLDLAKIEARKMELYPAPCYLPSVLQGVAEVARIKAEQKSIDFIYQAPENLPSGVIVDEKRLRQILLNILGNAIKFTDRGKVIFRVALISQLGELSVMSPDTVTLHFQIEDTGIGMSEEQLEKIFLPFEQVGTIKKQTEGTGLGLAITKSFVEMMGSNLEVRSQQGTGSVFEFTINCPLAEDWAKANTLTNLGQIVGYVGNRRQILVVDDRWENRSVLVSLLQPLGFTVIEAEHGEEALEKAVHNPPDLIISDLKMPIMDGWEMMKQLQQIEQLKNTILIISSASVFDADRQRSLAAGGHDFLPKPVQAEELYRILSQYLNLEWLYAESAATNIRSIKSVTENVNSEMLIPTIADLDKLVEYAMQGQIKKIQKELEAIVKNNDNYRHFADKINIMLKGYKLVEVREFLQKIISTEVS